MPLNFYKAREYILSQPFVEEVETEIARFNPFKNKPTYLGSMQSQMEEEGKKQTKIELTELRDSVRDEEKPNIDALMKVMETLYPPEGCYSIFLNPTLGKEDKYGPDKSNILKSVSAGLTDCTIFENLTESGFHLNSPVEFSHLVLELRLRQEVARKMIPKYHLSIESVPHDLGLIAATREMPGYQDINGILNFCMAYSQVTNTDRFKKTAANLAKRLEERITAIAERLILNQQ